MQAQSYHVLRILLAAVLLIAAGLKCHQLATEPVIGHSILDARWLLMLTVEFELFFGFWLLANVLPKLTWAAALTCFSLFTCVSLYKALSGYASCGCFGRVQVNPWYTSTLDLVFVVSLLIWRPRGLSRFSFDENGTVPFARAVGVMALWLMAGLPAAYAMGSYSDTLLSDAGDIIDNGKIVVLEPEKWIGKRFPLLPYIEDVPDIVSTDGHSLRERLVEGSWLVLLYHHDCPDCQEAIRILRETKFTNGIPQIALIEMPPYGGHELHEALSNTSETKRGVHMGRLGDIWEWLAETPCCLTLDDGVATRIGSAGEAKDLIMRITSSLRGDVSDAFCQWSPPSVDSNSRKFRLAVFCGHGFFKPMIFDGKLQIYAQLIVEPLIRCVCEKQM